jgi:hypothetical protein
MIVSKKRASLLDGFKPYLTERIESGCLKASVLHREVVAQGFSSGYGICPRIRRAAPGTTRPTSDPEATVDTASHRLDLPAPRQPHRPRPHPPDHDPRQLPRTISRRRAGALLRRDDDPATRSPPRQVAHLRRADRPATHQPLRQRGDFRPRRRDRRVECALQLWTGRGQRQPDQDAQTADVWQAGFDLLRKRVFLAG